MLSCKKHQNLSLFGKNCGHVKTQTADHADCADYADYADYTDYADF